VGDWLDSWSGEAVNWQCDELGHLNMRHYLGKAEEARQFLLIHLGLTHAFQRGAASSVRPREVTICYRREARPGARLSMRSAILRLGEVDADLIHTMHHADGTIAATFHEHVEHISLRTREPFVWPTRLREAAQNLILSDTSNSLKTLGPRGLPDIDAVGPSQDSLIKVGADRIGAGVFRPDEADLFGHISGMNFLGRLTESVGNFRKGWPEAYGPGGLYHPNTKEPPHLSGVLLEIRLYLHREAAPGRAFEVYSGLLSATPTIRNLVHHIIDPVNGESYISATATSSIIDLVERKLVRSTSEQLARLQANCLDELTP